MANAPLTIAQLHEKLDEANAKVAELEGSDSAHESTLHEAASENAKLIEENGTLGATIESLQSELTDAKAGAAESEKSLESTAKMLADVSLDLDEANDALAAAEERADKLEADSKSAEERAAKIAADSGTDPVEVTDAPDASDDDSRFASMSVAELWAHAESLKDTAETRAFYIAHIQPRSSERA